MLQNISQAAETLPFALAEADLQTPRGEHDYTVPRPGSPLRLEEEAEAGCCHQWTPKTAFRPLFQQHISGIQHCVSNAVHRINLATG